MTFAFGVAALALALAAPAEEVQAARAPDTSLSPYELDVTVPAIASGGILALLVLSDALVKPSLSFPQSSCKMVAASTHCDPSELHSFDRSAVGNTSEHWRRASDAGMGLAALLPIAASAFDSYTSNSTTPGRDFAADTLVIAEAVSVATLLTHVLKYAVRRPRPRQYSADTFGGGFERATSFPSGHTSSTAAAAAAYAMTFGLRHPNSPWRWAVYAAAVVLPVVTGVARVQSGWHFYSDVLAGLAIGGATGVLMPRLHVRRDTPVSVSLMRNAQPLAPVYRGVTLTFAMP